MWCIKTLLSSVQCFHSSVSFQGIILVNPLETSPEDPVPHLATTISCAQVP